MICPNCRKMIADNSTVCIYCGTRLNPQPNHYNQQVKPVMTPQQSYRYATPQQPQARPVASRQNGHQIPNNIYSTPAGNQYYAHSFYPQGQMNMGMAVAQPVKSKKKAVVAIIVAVALLISTIATVLGFAVSGNSETNTIMIYMVGSNLESSYGAASKDISEMLKSDIDFSNNNVLIYAGGSTSWNLNIPTDYNSVIKLGSKGCEVVAGTEAPENMGDSNTLLNFLNYCYENYKTDNYSLILWDHGAGPVFGFGSDELFYGDGLNAEELKAALDASPFKAQNKLNWIGFDACLMSCVEIADVVSDHADYMIASQETEPGTGWDYSFLSIYNSTSDSVAVAQSVIDSYQKSVSLFEYTLSCLDLSKLSNLESAMDDFFGGLDSYLDSGDYITIARNRENTKAFGLSSSVSKGDSFDLIDLGNLTDCSLNECVNEAKQLRNAIDDMVIYHKSNVYGSSGISIYHPYDNKAMYEAYGIDFFEKYSISQEYTSYIEKFTQLWLNGNASDGFERNIWKMSDTQQNDDAITMQLTPEQLKSYSSAEYTILLKDECESKTVYVPILLNCKVEPDENGLISVPASQDVFGINDMCFPVLQTELNDENTSYITYASMLSNGDINFDPIAMTEGIKVSFSVDKDGEITLGNVALSDSSQISNKTTIDYTKWESIEFTYKMYIPKYDNENNLLPYDTWDDNGWVNIASCDLDDEISISKQTTSEANAELVCQITVKDCQGNSYASDLAEIKQIKSRLKKQKTENGTLTFRVYSDHATVVDYEGKDKVLKIPRSIDGKKVTEIGTQAFEEKSEELLSNVGNQNINEIVLPNTITTIDDLAFDRMSNLNKINLPNSLELIGNRAFYATALNSISLPDSITFIGKDAFHGTNIKSVNIPASVKTIGSNPFVSCEDFTKITIDKDNENYKVIDGVLCTSDGKQLIIGINSKDITVPDGVEVIGEYAFANYNSVASISIPDSVKEIDNYAFFNTSIYKVQLPEGLETIGFCAFRNTLWDDLGDENAVNGLTKLTIPVTVNYIGEAAFSGQPISEFTVADGNESFSANGQFLLNKSGEQLIACGGGIGGKVSVPDGVKEIKSNAFEGCNKLGRFNDKLIITQLTVPDSVIAIKADLDLFHLEKLIVGKNVIVWNYIKYLNNSIAEDELQVQISKDNSYYAVVNGEIVEKNKK